MNPLRQFLLIVLLGLCANYLYAAEDGVQRWSEPYQKGNLTIFIAYGDDNINAQHILTLDEALDKGKIKVNETGTVNNLAAENLSKTQDVFIQSGDIVKGGKQDRVLSVDLVLPPQSGKVNISSFCVESGRWQKRGKEDNRSFNSARKRVVSKELKLAAKLKKDQSEVWQKVEEAQRQLSEKLGTPVKNSLSQSSLQLSLENRELKNNLTSYKSEYSDIVNKSGNAIGYAYAINGEINGADVYGASDLFKKMWPRLLDATVTEALSKQDTRKQLKQVSEDDLRQWLKQTQSEKSSEEKISNNTILHTYENTEQAKFETKDKRYGDKTVHRNILSK